MPTNIENPNKADSCLIVGHDADLVLYGLRAALNRNVTIFHPNAKSGTEYNINTMIEMLMESTNQDKDNSKTHNTKNTIHTHIHTHQMYLSQT